MLVLEAGTDGRSSPKLRGHPLDIPRHGPVAGHAKRPVSYQPDALSPNDSKQDPYFIQTGQKRFMSDYIRTLGGSTLHWQGTTLRMLPNDFRMQSAYGQAVDWPVSYDELEPFYREAEHEVGVSANVEDQAFLGVWFRKTTCTRWRGCRRA